MSDLEGLDPDRRRAVGALLSSAFGGDGAGAEAFAGAYFRFEPRDDLVGSSAPELAAVAAGHLRAALVRAPGEVLVTAAPGDGPRRGALRPLVAHIVVDDMPFLVDSVSLAVRAATHAQGAAEGAASVLTHLRHPTVVAHRDARGRLDVSRLAAPTATAPTATAPAPAADVATPRRVESWMRVDVLVPDDDLDAAADDLADRLRSALHDVRLAVGDHAEMAGRARDVAARIVDEAPAALREEAEQARRLLGWLADDHFTFIGYREYRLVTTAGGQDALDAVPGTGLGLLRDAPRAGTDETGGSIARSADGSRTGGERADGDRAASGPAGRRSGGPRVLVGPVAERAREARVLVVTTANARSTVHRDSHLDYVGVKVFGPDGAVVGERRFLGLHSLETASEDVLQVPLLQDTARGVIAALGRPLRSHEGQDLLAILQALPRDELFQASVEEIAPVALAVLHLQQRPRPRLFLRHDPYRRFVSVLVYVPRDRYSTALRLAVTEVVRRRFAAVAVEQDWQVGGSVLARLHLVVRLAADERGTPDAAAVAAARAVDPAALEAEVTAATRTWGEDLVAELERTGGPVDAVRDWEEVFPDGYRERFAPETAATHLTGLGQLAAAGDPSALTVHLDLTHHGSTPLVSATVLRLSPLLLSEVLAVFGNLGLEVVEEHPHDLVVAARPGAAGDAGAPETGSAHVYEFLLRPLVPLAEEAATRALAVRLAEAFVVAYRGRTTTDALDRLVLVAGMTWRQVIVLRAYAAYLRQSGWAYSTAYVHAALVAHPEVATALWELFAAAHDPAAGLAGGTTGGSTGASTGEPGPRETAALVARVEELVDEVTSLDQDRILRAVLDVVRATLRTNAYRRLLGEGQDGSTTALAFKLAPAGIPVLPRPLPAVETWVFGSEVEGTHLRFGAVARGGIRWSDRAQDFRTEVLGLVKAQVVKNALIVPTGAKGAFYPRHLPPASERDAWVAAGRSAYTSFIEALLDVVDDLRPLPGGGYEVVPAPGVVRHDGDDTYLVVAADKGTATFSDTANAVALERGFWLGDAFASGGSHGYDHKAMGITARGAWESVRRHFLELGTDVQRDRVRVVGVGDMSGDVFGNGLLRSRTVQLVAAFDHRHVFLDPDPDPEASFAERARLFALPRSSWADYDTSLISAGGGVHPRTAKSVPVTAQVREALGLPDDVVRLSPDALVSAVLRAPVDLLFNGGIGTYVRAVDESDAQAGDRANDPVRVTGEQLRVRVVGEGGNLGLTQRGRIEAARHGVALNTDAVDNSAGVDTSDHEVNLKIALAGAIARGDLAEGDRDALLLSMTDEIAERVLAHDHDQNVVLSLARGQASVMAPVHRRLLEALSAGGHLDRALEDLPDDGAMAARVARGEGLVSPELAVLLAYVKTDLQRSLLASAVPDEPWTQPFLTGYFPAAVVELCGDHLREHPLAREIITTSLVNTLVDDGGMTTVYRAVEETGAEVPEVVRAWGVVREVLDQRGHVRALHALDGVVDSATQAVLHRRFRRLVDRSLRWLVHRSAGGGPLDVVAVVTALREDVAALRSGLPERLGERDAAGVADEAAQLRERGVPAALAVRHAGLLKEYSLLAVADLAARTGAPLETVAAVFFGLSEEYRLGPLLVAVSGLPRASRWQAQARAVLRDEHYAALEDLTEAVLRQPAPGAGPRVGAEQLLAAWEERTGRLSARARTTVEEVLDAPDAPGSTALTVTLGSLRELVRSRPLTG